ncbi:MAG: C40 family peptidase [Armatimonadetes bacterium]|nr:C40 family peptidase [Armatimonadota bacterium]
MNPRLRTASISPGTILFVPTPGYVPPAATAVASAAVPAPEPLVEPTAPPQTDPIETDDPSEEEWQYLSQYASLGKLDPVPQEEEPGRPNLFIGSDGEAVVVPAVEARTEQTRRILVNQRPYRQLSSRRGRALYGLLKTSRSFMGIPYVWGGESPRGADCSGYVQMVFARHGVKLPRTADVQFKVGSKVPKGKERPGDLVFFETYAPGASHVGIYLGNYLGNRKFIHASSRAGKVAINGLDEEFFKKRYLGARRHF